ncbi:response regulator transcription factor [Catenulispora rubra]|uniref:response regulator transcription factor n=1 Tax=Catenulispora rubra TaxID=280293 RepID=UPI00189223E9|nr:response regulator transcription factor [Catenulispora rubra]
MDSVGTDTAEPGRAVLRVAVVDDHPVARRGIAAIIAGFPDLRVCATVAEACELPRRPEDGQVDADVVVLDLYQADGHPALPAIAELSAQRPVLVLSASRSPAVALAAVRAGAAGFLTKAAQESAYAAAIRAVAAGTFYLSAQLADLIQAATLRGATGPQDALSPREQEALGFIACGFTHQQTATRMGISKGTVDTYVARIRTKLQLGNKAELTLAALRIPPV